MGSLFSDPKPPKANNNNTVDPEKVAKTQYKYNTKAAQDTINMSAINQTDPYGTMTYTKDAHGNVTGVTQALTPDQQALLDQQEGIGKTTNETAAELAQHLKDRFANPVDLSSSATEARLDELGQLRLDPMFEKRRAALENQLTNQGLRPSDEAWKNAMLELSQESNDAYNQLFLTGHQTAANDILNENSSMLNALGGLYSFGSPHGSNWVNTPNATIQPANYSDLAVNRANSIMGLDQNTYNQKVASQNALYGAIGGAAGTALGGWATGKV